MEQYRERASKVPVTTIRFTEKTRFELDRLVMELPAGDYLVMKEGRFCFPPARAFHDLYEPDDVEEEAE